jgi:hypothetical protein
VRTSLDIDDDVLAAVKELARRENTSAGRIVSRVLKHSLTSAPSAAGEAKGRPAVGAFRPFEAGHSVTTTKSMCCETPRVYEA